jgi:hypothetical protein
MRVARQYRSHARTLQPALSGRTTPPLGLVAYLVLLLMAAPSAHAAVSLLLEQPYGKLNLFLPSGHSAIYLDHVCAETPLKLRPCRPGELGVVISRYDDISNHDWVAMPLIPYLYSVSSAAEIPQSVDRASESQLRDTYRRQYLQSVAPDRPDGSAPGGNWYELVGSAFDRTIYGFRLNTTAEQDAKFIATFNDRRNVEDYNGALHNCADFARVTINQFYPHAVRRNYIADLGMTSPKSVARSLSHYASKHPGVGFEVFVIPQVNGDLPRSHSNKDLAEYILKRYSVPLVVVSPISTAVVFAAYVGQGRFSMPKHPPLLLDLDELSSSDPSKSINRPFPPMLPSLPPPVRTLMTASEGGVTMPAAKSAAARVSLVHAGMVP